MVRKIGQLFKIFKILIIPSFWLIFDDVTVTLSLVVLSCIFFHKLTFVLSYSIAKVVKIECHLHAQKNRLKKSLGRGRVVATLNTLPLSNFRGRSDLKTFFMDRCPKDEPTAKNLVCKKLFPFPRKIEKNLLGEAASTPLGHRRVNAKETINNKQSFYTGCP